MSGAWRAGLLYAALTFVLAYPLSIHPGGNVVSPSPDTNLFLWTLQWDVHALTHQPWAIFEANIYYPEHRTLAYSENLLGSAPLAAPILWLTGNPVLAMNLIVLAGCVLCGVGTYLLARRVGVGECGATLSGLVFAFSPARFLRLDQFHLATIEWVPFALASLHAYWNEGRARDLRLAVGFFTLQALSSGHGAVFLMVAGGVLIGFRVLRGESRVSLGWIRDLGLTGAFLALPTVLVLLPYRTVQQEMGLRRSLENWAVPWTSFLASSTHVHSFLLSLVPSWQINETPGPQLFPGWIPIVLALAAFTWWRGRWPLLAGAVDVVGAGALAVGVAVAVTGATRFKFGDTVVLSIREVWRPWALAAIAAAARAGLVRKAPFRLSGLWRNGVLLPYAVITMVSILLAAGRPVSLWPLVYWLPGLNFIRAPSRFILLTVLGLAVLAGIGFDRLTAGVSRPRRRLVAFAVGALLVAECFAAPIGLEAYRPEIPAIDRWLATQPQPFVVAEVPVGDPGNLGEWERRETAFMLHSTAHWQKTVHGYSGFRSSAHEILYARLTTFPDPESVERLQVLGVTYVVVHTDLYPPGEWDKTAARLAQFGDALTLEHVEGDGRVYALAHAR